MDEDAKQQLRLLMGGEVATSDGRTTTGLSLGPADPARFFLGPPIDLSPRLVSETAEHVASGFAAEGFTLTGKSLPGVAGPRQLTRRPAAVGIVVAERDVAPDTTYDRTTRWVCGVLVLLWIAIAMGTFALERGWWIQAVFLGAFAFALPAYVVNSYRGRGYTGLVAVGELSSLAALGPIWDGSIPELPLRVRIGAARVKSRQSIGRNLGRRWVRSVEASPEAAAASQAVNQRFSTGANVDSRRGEGLAVGR